MNNVREMVSKYICCQGLQCRPQAIERSNQANNEIEAGK